MHELGHTVGLIHSGAGPSAYGDESGYMVRASLPIVFAANDGD